MVLELGPLRVRPDLLDQVLSGAIQGSWPEFMQHDRAALLYFGRPYLDAYLDTAFAVVQGRASRVQRWRALFQMWFPRAP
jgi:hypothetical protein